MESGTDWVSYAMDCENGWFGRLSDRGFGRHDQAMYSRCLTHAQCSCINPHHDLPSSKPPWSTYINSIHILNSDRWQLLKQELCSDLSRSHDALYLTEDSNLHRTSPKTHILHMLQNLLVQSYFNNSVGPGNTEMGGESPDSLLWLSMFCCCTKLHYDIVILLVSVSVFFFLTNVGGTARWEGLALGMAMKFLWFMSWRACECLVAIDAAWWSGIGGSCLELQC